MLIKSDYLKHEDNHLVNTNKLCLWSLLLKKNEKKDHMRIDTYKILLLKITVGKTTLQFKLGSLL